MYLIDRATKFEQGKKEVRSYLIENGQVQYVNQTFHKWGGKKVDMKGTIMMNGRVMLANELLDCGTADQFHARQMMLVKKGCTTIAVAPVIEYEKQLDLIYEKTKHKLANSTLDFLIGLTVPIRLIRPTFLRKCQKLHIPFLIVRIEEGSQIQALQWAHLSHALGSYQIVLIPVSSKHELISKWVSVCSAYHIHTSLPITEETAWEKPLLQKVGLYPERGTLITGSSADYLLFHDNADFDQESPTVVIVKGTIIKENDRMRVKPGYGKQIDIKQPGKLLSINFYKVELA